MFGDLYNIRKRIKSIDKNLDMVYRGNGIYEILHKKGHFMTVSKEELNGGLVERVREIVYKNVNADILAEIEANNLKIDSRKEKDFENLAEDLAKDIYPYVRRM